MKNRLPNTLLSFILLLAFSVPASATADSGRQYSSTRQSKAPDELTSKLNQLYLEYVAPQTTLTGMQKSKIRTTLNLICGRLKNQPGPANSWKKVLQAFIGSAPSAKAFMPYGEVKEPNHKKKFFSFLNFRSKPVERQLKADVRQKEERKSKRRGLRLFKWVK